MWTKITGGVLGALLLAATAAPTTIPNEPDGGPGAVTDATTSRTDTTKVQSGLDQRETVSITVYNQNFALVREIRQMDLPGGLVALEFGDVAASLQPETVHIRPVGGNGLEVLEQNYRYDLLTPEKLLEKYVGRTVTLYRPNRQTGIEEAVQAEVLSVHGGVVLRIGDEITYDVPGRFAFPEVPSNLIPDPTLVWLLNTEDDRQTVEVSYLTRDMSWKSDYVVVLEDDDRSAGITGWVTLDNRSGTSFDAAQLKLVAGDVQRVSDVAPMAVYDRLERAAEREAFTEEEFFEYHLYSLGRPTNVKNNEQKQVTLLEAEGFAVQKRLVFAGSPYYYRGSYGDVQSNQKVGTFLEFDNSENAGLGMPLPAGIVRVYKRDSSGAQQFVGEDRIDHTPRNEGVRIKLGDAFDVVGDRRQMRYEVVSSCVSESTWRVDLRNHKTEDVTIDIVEPVGGDWQILSASHDWERRDSGTFVFRVDVGAGEEETVEYRVRVRWC